MRAQTGLAQAVVRPPLLPVAQMQQDVAVLQASLTALHPGLYRYNSYQQVEQYFQQLRRQVSQPLPLSAFYLRLSQFTAKLHCGHTYPNPFNLSPELRSQLFSDHLLPVYFRVCAGHWVVTHNLSASPQLRTGDEIVAINGIPVRRITDSLLTVSRADGRHGTAKLLDNLNLTPTSGATYALFDQYFSLFFPASQADFTLTVQPSGRPAFQLPVAAQAKDERQRAFTQRFGPLPTRRATWQYRLLDAQTAYLKIGDLAIWGWGFDARRYLDSVFTDLEQRRCERLVVDIRGCEGGDDATRNVLLSYLMPHAFGCENPTRRLLRALSVPDSLLPYLHTWDPSFKEPKPASLYQLTAEGLYEKRSEATSPCQPQALATKRFKGHFALLIDAANSSTTFTLAEWVQQARAGVLVGQPTGGTKQGLNGGSFSFYACPAAGWK
ncbi:S41 family peptidase [Hymenobacter sp. BRD67]|uniref:S41 family peptidase n=1 Tax=Hymenobacter sp. BRD67 TaxID=2675877 RepID=UPI001566F819|nr:S41 family peptidase [Hymenobacter sp. BRD67]QKG51952.1 hypothetical protein GKZ67_04175 [Hymenobacter sp. BRD67]